MILHLDAFTGFALLFMRIMVGLVFADSGFNHVRNPAERGKSIGLPPGLTAIVGTAELIGGAAVILGFLAQFAAIGLALIMLGAIQKKIFDWKTGFWGKDGLGWNYELIMISMLGVVACTGGGPFVV